MKRLTIFLIAVSFFTISCQSSSRSSGSKNNWPSGMQKVAEPLQDLSPYIYNKNAYHNKDNEKTIHRGIERLEKLVHRLPEKDLQKMFGKDPLLTHNLRDLKGDLARAKNSFSTGHTEYSRMVLRGAVNHCFQCHSRTQDGPEYHYMIPQLKTAYLSVTEKAEFLVATRQYERATKLLRDYLIKPESFYNNPYENTRAVKRYLALMVRIKKAPSKAVDTLETYTERKKLPYYMTNNIEAWIDDLKRWSGEKKVKSNKLRTAKRLIRRGNQNKSYNLDAGYISFLRASSLLHESLQTVKKASQRAEIYKLLGTAYESLADLGFWSLPESYFAECIHEAPRTKTAKTCYKDFEKNVILGFAGSRGIFLPKEEQQRLRKLKELAGFKPANSTNK